MADICKLESELCEAADDLRANSKLTSQQYCMPVPGLIFLRYVWGRFKRADEQIEAERAAISGRKSPKEVADYTSKGAMFIPEEARYDYLLNLPDGADTGKVVNDAMASIAAVNPLLTIVLPDTYTELGNDRPQSLSRATTQIPLPELMQRYSAVVCPAYEQIDVCQQRIAAVCEARDRLLPKLMSGEIEV